MMGKWLIANKKKVLLHSLILGGFLLYSLFGAEPLFERFEAVPGEANLVELQLPHETDDMHYNLDRIVATTSALEIHGWAFTRDHDIENNETYVVLKSDERLYAFDTSAIYSSQITLMYEELDLDLDWAGFITVIPVRKIDPAEYEVGIYITGNGVQALHYTEETIVRSKDDIRVGKENDQE
jgi:hypothetical protein